MNVLKYGFILQHKNKVFCSLSGLANLFVTLYLHV